MTQINAEYVTSCIRAGFQDSQIAQACGVTQSAVAQYIEEHKLREAAGVHQKFQDIDDTLNDIELLVAKRLKQAIALEVNPMKLAHVLRTVNGAKRRSLSEGQPLPGSAAIVRLELPKHMQLRIQHNAQNEVIAVEDQNLRTFQAGRLLEHVTKHNPASNTQNLGVNDAKAAAAQNSGNAPRKGIADLL